MKPEITYILSVLHGLNGSQAFSEKKNIHYGPPETASAEVKIIFFPSGFFDKHVYGTMQSLPALPLRKIENIPLLYGQPKIQRHVRKDGINQMIVYADIIASSYFLLTRYEEIVRSNIRDQHGRFPGYESLPFRAGFLDRPIVDEYKALLRKWLGEVGLNSPEQKRQLKVTLTHDVDNPYEYNSILETLIPTAYAFLKDHKNLMKPLCTYMQPCKDPYQNFDWIIQQDNDLKNAFPPNTVKSMYFMMAAKAGITDGSYRIKSRRVKRLMKKLHQSGAELGYHPSYAAGMNPKKIPKEKKKLELASGLKITSSRHHYLAWREPEDVRYLEKTGLTDDYTMGYADQSGFRLGICHPVLYFEPKNRRLTTITVHPLHIMDNTLEAEAYLNLPYERAKEKCEQVIKTVYMHKGELVLLWHNTALTTPYHNRLYLHIIKMLKKFN